MLKAYVDFRHPVLFVKEIQAICTPSRHRDTLGTDDGVVRVTQLREQDHANAHVRHVFIVATAIHDDLVLRLRFGVGRLQDRDTDDEVKKKADQIAAGLIRDLEAAGVEVRGGVINALQPEAA